MNLLTKISRLVVGFVFVFSGFVKGIDPMGSAYKLNDYFSAFHLAFLDSLALPLSILLCTTEFLAGMMLISGSCTKTASWLVTLFMVIFTPLTLFLALFNPVSDCGCFGDAIHMTNWETFFKNIIISAFVIVIFIRRNDKNVSLKTRDGIMAIGLFIIVFLIFIHSNLRNLPLIDFRPYKTGTNLPEGMTIPPYAPANKYDTRFIYEKDGIEKEFTLSDYPANDTTWKFVDQKSVLVSKGFTPPIHDFSLTTKEGTDLTEKITGFRGYTLLMITRKIEEAKLRDITKGLKAGDIAEGHKISFYIVTASENRKAEALSADYNVLFCDETTLKTVIRANPGFVLLHNGTVAAMWSVASLPSFELFSQPEKLQTDNHNRNSERQVIFIAIFGIIIILALCISIRKPINHNNNS
jgi:uncharacterized membrane protein YphA (DoxX/SURF4 family)